MPDDRRPTRCRHFSGIQHPCRAGETIPTHGALGALRRQGRGLPCMSHGLVPGATPAECASRSWFTRAELDEQDRENKAAIAALLADRCPTCRATTERRGTAHRLAWVCPTHGVVASGHVRDPDG